MRLEFENGKKEPVWIMKKDDEDFYRLFVKAYINAKLERNKAFIVDFIKKFKAEETLTDDIFVSYYHLFFWRKTPITPDSMPSILRMVKEMRRLAGRKYKEVSEKEQKLWGRLMLGLENYIEILEEGIKKKKNIVMTK